MNLEVLEDLVVPERHHIPDILDFLGIQHLGHLDFLVVLVLQYFLEDLEDLEDQILEDLDFLALPVRPDIQQECLENQEFLEGLEGQLFLGFLVYLGFLDFLVDPAQYLDHLGLLVILLFPVDLVGLAIRGHLVILVDLLYLVRHSQKQQNHANLALKYRLGCYQQICTITPLRSLKFQIDYIDLPFLGPII